MRQLEKINILKPVFGKLFRLLKRRHKIYFFILLVLTIGFSLVETVGVSVIMPFISLASNPRLIESGWYKTAFDLLGFSGAESFIIALGIGIIFFYIFRAVYSVFLSYAVNRFSLGTYKYFSKNVFKAFLSIPYKVYAKKNSGEMMHAILEETGGVSKIILNLMQLFSEFFTVLLVYAVIIILNWQMTMIVTAVLLFLVIVMLSITTRVNKAYGIKRIAAGKAMNRGIREALGNIKYVKLKGNEENILRSYDATIEISSRADVVNNLLGIVPKSILESVGFSLLIAAVVFVVWTSHDASQVIPIISMYALALYRILPSVHRMLLNISNIAYMEKALENVDENLRQNVEDEKTEAEPLAFREAIRLADIHFNYAAGEEVLAGISLQIGKGEKVAITGESGSGKSTLADIIMGIHKPVSGQIYIDSEPITNENIRSWRKKIGYIPQNIYLFDGTVAENVCFGSVPDNEAIVKALKRANIWDFLAQKNGLDTPVGDGGIQLSGGQVQRIGIARALYDDPEVLVLDEATSALDTETEEKIMDEIYNVSANKTLIVIAHRLSTVERCDRRIKIKNGRIV